MKKLEKFGLAGRDYTDIIHAIGDTYTTRDGEHVSTNLIPEVNPFKKEILNAKNILDIGCGVGRNLKWIMENTDAHYHGLDPNESMLNFFWQVQYVKWKDRVTLHSDFSTIVPELKFDVVISTFVFQHIAYWPAEHQMNIDDITQNVRMHTGIGTVWFLFEHERERGEEGRWIQRWLTNNNIVPQVYIRDYTGLEELTHRESHHLIIWKEENKVRPPIDYTIWNDELTDLTTGDVIADYSEFSGESKESIVNKIDNFKSYTKADFELLGEDRFYHESKMYIYDILGANWITWGPG